MTDNKKSIYIKTYGCQMNAYDSIRMADVMRPFGYQEAQSPDNADLVILNTCHIREKAAEKVYSELGRIRKLKNKKNQNNEKMLVAVAGCVGQAEGEEIFKRAPFVDIVVGPQSYQSLPDLVGKIQRDSGHAINLEFEDDKFDKLPKESIPQAGAAMVSIQEGCDKFCTFCVVPYTRGAEYSRPVSDIYRESIKLVSQGAKEISLLGQNVNAYHGIAGDDSVWNLGQLIKHLAKIEGLERIRYTTSHPRDMHEALFEAHATIQQLMPLIHLPVQSGSNNILERMNRKHRRDEYFKIIDRLRKINPRIEFSSDFIVGFPGETDKDFEYTLDLVRRVKYAQAYSFKYSPRPGTPGSDMDDQVPEDVKNARLQTLQELLNQQQLEFNKSSQGQVLDVLFERQSHKNKNQLIGKTPYQQSVHVYNASKDLIGKIKKVRIIEGMPNSLSGEIIKD